MSIKVKVSYTDEQEFSEIMRLLSPVVKSWKRKQKNGRYYRAYSAENVKGNLNNQNT